MQRRLVLILIALQFVAPMVASLIPTPASAGESPPYRLYLPILFNSVPPLSEIRLVAVADTYVAQGGAEAKPGADFFLLAGYDSDPTSQEGIVRTLIRFDLSGLASQPIAKATLRIYYAGYRGIEGQTVLVNVWGIKDRWVESEVTWTNQPEKYADAYVSTGIRGDDQWGYREFNLTSLVEQWLNGAKANYGVYVFGPETNLSDAAYRAFLSRESVTTNAPYPPELVIDFN